MKSACRLMRNGKHPWIPDELAKISGQSEIVVNPTLPRRDDNVRQGIRSCTKAVGRTVHHAHVADLLKEVRRWGTFGNHVGARSETDEEVGTIGGCGGR